MFFYFKAYCLDVEPSFKELGRIARRIGAENEIVGIELGLQKYEIDQLTMTYKDLITDVNFQILKNWKIRMRERGTFAKLKYALYSAGCNMDVIIQVWDNKKSYLTICIVEQSCLLVNSDI